MQIIKEYSNEKCHIVEPYCGKPAKYKRRLSGIFSFLHLYHYFCEKHKDYFLRGE